jgi:hypothetical protein
MAIDESKIMEPFMLQGEDKSQLMTMLNKPNIRCKKWIYTYKSIKATLPKTHLRRVHYDES